MKALLGKPKHLIRAMLTSFLFVLLAFALLAIKDSVLILAVDDKREDRDRLKELQEQSADLYKKIQEGQKEAKEKQQEATSLSSQIDRIETNIDVTEKKIAELEQNILHTQEEITKTEGEIGHTQEELNKLGSHQNEILRTVYETEITDPLLILASSKSISDVIAYSEQLETLEYQIEGLIYKSQELKRNLEDQKAKLEAKNNELNSLKSQQEAYKVGLAEEKGYKDQLLVQAKKQQSEIERQVTEARSLADQVEKQMLNIRERLVSGNGPGIVKARDKGTSTVGFQWPTDYRYISTYFGGSTPFQPRGGHGGLDLVNSAGTPIYAASDGTVTAVEEMKYNGRYYAYGKYVVIGHNARWSTLYAHLQSFAVASGDEVKRGDIVGYMGSTGWSTGPHLHFEIWDYDARVNPIKYLPE